MRLIWFVYSNHDDALRKQYKRKYILGILLGEMNEKMHILMAENLTNDEVILVRSAIENLESLELDKRIAWFKKMMPRAFNSGYKTIYKNRITVMDEFPISQ